MRALLASYATEAEDLGDDDPDIVSVGWTAAKFLG
jgi:hypothetical protein